MEEETASATAQTTLVPKKVRLFYIEGVVDGSDRIRPKDGLLLSSDNGRYTIRNLINGQVEEYPFTSVARVEFKED